MTIKCANCGSENKDGSRFCKACGQQLPEIVSAASAFAPIGEQSADQALPKSESAVQTNTAASPFASIERAAERQAQEQRLADFTPAFAEGLPNWDLVPPNIMVMRKG